jgi:hypothetical protein
VGKTPYTFPYSAFSESFRGEGKLLKEWRRGSESNRRIKVLQTSPLPLGYRAILHNCNAGPGRNQSGKCDFQTITARFAGSNEIFSLTRTPLEALGTLRQGSHLERETGLEPATLALARRCSTTELLPHTS